MAGYTYSTLVTDVVANMEEDSAEFLAAMPAIIERAQTYLQRRCDVVNILLNVEAAVSAGSRLVSLPDDLLVLKNIQIAVSGTGIINLTQQTNEYLVAYWPVFTSTDTPKYYAPYDNSAVLLAPTPASATTAYLEYVPKVAVLTSTAPSNWFSTDADAAFFAAAMMYANMWTKNGEATTRWKAAADEELTVINNEAKRARRSDNVDRSRGSPENNLAENP